MPAETQIIKANQADSIFLADNLMEDLTAKGKHICYQREEKMMYIYNGKFYEPLEQIDIDKFIYDFICTHQITKAWKSSRRSEIQRAIEVSDMCPTVEFNNYPNLINMENGIFNIDTNELLPHDHKYFFNSIVSCNYDPQAPEPSTFLDFLNSCFTKSDGSVDFDTVNSLITIGSTLIYPKSLLGQSKLFIFLGEGANGKSMLSKVYEMFFPKNMVSYLTLEDLSVNGFERIKLVGSRFNVSTESKSKAVDAEEIKKIISGEGITIRRKYGDQFNYHPICKILVSSNTRPYFNDTTHGIMRRLHITEFKNKFVPAHIYNSLSNPQSSLTFLAKDEEEMINNFKKELSGIFNLFLTNLKILKQNGMVIPETQNTKDITAEYRDANDTVGAWLRENYEVDNNPHANYVSSSELLVKYREWYAEHVSTKALNYSSISMGLKIKEIFRISSVRMFKDKKQIKGFRLKEILYPSQEEVDEFIKDNQETVNHYEGHNTLGI